MTLFQSELHFTVLGCDSPQELDDHLDAVLDHLHDLDNVTDPDITAALATGKVLISMVVEAEDDMQALICALSAARTAVHAADGATPGWSAHFQNDQHHVTRSELIGA